MTITRRIGSEIHDSLSFFSVVSIIGPRQVGKTTLAKTIMAGASKPTLYLDLELQSDLNKLDDAELFFSYHTDKLVVVDEVQNKKELYPLLRALVDKTGEPGQFLLLGPASPELIRHSSESLAGRIAYHQLFPFDLTEIPESVTQNDLWMKGGFPKSLFAPGKDLSQKWMENFVSTYLNRDLLQLGLSASPTTIRNLWSMMAYLNGQLFNATNLANSLDVTTPTVKRYIDFLEEAFLLKSLHPLSWNMKKRLVKSPKIYLTDTGILHYLTGITDFNSLTGNPIIGSSWETFVVNQLLALKPNQTDLYFYRTIRVLKSIWFLPKDNVVATRRNQIFQLPATEQREYLAFDDLNAPINYVIIPSSMIIFSKNVSGFAPKAFIAHLSFL